MKRPNSKVSVPDFGMIPSDSWIVSLRAQLRQIGEERKNPPPELKLSVEPDPTALQNLVDSPSPFSSLIVQIRELVDEIIHPKEKFETSAELVEVEDVWAARNLRTPGLISMAAHVFTIVLLVFPIFGSGPTPLNITETFVPLVSPLILNLPDQDEQSGGGGGGGLMQEEPPSIGELPRPADEQLVPPTPEILNFDPILVAEPTVVAPQLANLQPTINLAMLGAPDGIPGPPSAGPGVGGGIGTGQGRGVGEGSGPGVGEGEGGGFGGGVFSIGGGVTTPTLLYQILPEYSEEARKGQISRHRDLGHDRTQRWLGRGRSDRSKCGFWIGRQSD